MLDHLRSSDCENRISNHLEVLIGKPSDWIQLHRPHMNWFLTSIWITKENGKFVMEVTNMFPKLVFTTLSSPDDSKNVVANFIYDDCSEDKEFYGTSTTLPQREALRSSMQIYCKQTTSIHYKCLVARLSLDDRWHNHTVRLKVPIHVYLAVAKVAG